MLKIISRNDEGYLGACQSSDASLIFENSKKVETEKELSDWLFILNHPFSYYDTDGNVVQDTKAFAKAEKKREARQEIATLKQYLSETDYVISKLNELKLEDEDEYEKAKNEYADVLVKRKEARKRINELEAE